MTMRRILVVTTNGDSREDGNVYASAYYLVTAQQPSQNFQEPEFGSFVGTTEQLVARLTELGYQVTQPGVSIVAIDEDDD